MKLTKFYSVNLLNMKQNIIIDFKDIYPFGACYHYISNAAKVLVRQKVITSTNSQENLKLKISLLRKANTENLIKLQLVQEKTNQIHLLYEYVPILMEPWISNINSTFIESTKLQLARVASFLAENHILADISLSKLGMNEKYQVKYFLGVDFEINPQKSTYDISIYYMNQILQIFHPYIFGARNRLPKKSMIDQIQKTKGQNQLNAVKLNLYQTPSNATQRNPQTESTNKNAPKKTKITELLKKVNNFKKQNGIIRDNKDKLQFNSRQQKTGGTRSQQKSISQYQTGAKMKLSMPISPKENQQHISYFYHPKHKIQKKKFKLNRSLQECKGASDAEFAQNVFQQSRKRISTLTIMETQNSDEKNLLNKKVQIAISSSLVAIRKCKSISQKNQ